MRKSFVFIGSLLIFTFNLNSCSYEDQVQKEVNNISSQVARDAEKQYEIAKKNGEDMDAYIQAGIVAASYLQANDEENYKKWKKIEKEAGKKVGL